LVRQWTLGYDLDGGGHEFEEPSGGYWKTTGDCVLLWEDPDLDYIIGSDILRGQDGTADLLVIAPNTGHHPAYQFPSLYVERDSDGDVVTYKRLVEGHLRISDRECYCHGKFVEHTGAAGEADEPEPPEIVVQWLNEQTDDVGDYLDSDVREHVLLDVDGEVKAVNLPVTWQYTGSIRDKPYPGCDRCEGGGYLDSPGGEFALYTRIYTGLC
jgi:hypothetical protein